MSSSYLNETFVQFEFLFTVQYCVYVLCWHLISFHLYSSAAALIVLWTICPCFLQHFLYLYVGFKILISAESRTLFAEGLTRGGQSRCNLAPRGRGKHSKELNYNRWNTLTYCIIQILALNQCAIRISREYLGTCKARYFSNIRGDLVWLNQIRRIASRGEKEAMPFYDVPTI